jgi:hypothetical protein
VLTYKGTAKFIEKDHESRTIAIEASGKETRGAGTASANVKAVLTAGATDGSTLVAIHTSLNVTGRPAQFGRSLLPEVSGKLIAQAGRVAERVQVHRRPPPEADPPGRRRRRRDRGRYPQAHEEQEVVLRPGARRRWWRRSRGGSPAAPAASATTEP